MAQALKEGTGARESKWSESIAVGSKKFVKETKARLGIRAAGRKIHEAGEQFELKEAVLSYEADFGPENSIIDAKNTYFWDVYY